MYQALYRKYRPSSFDDVCGQENIVETLKNAIINNKLSHAYLFSGPRGTGKTSVAKILARTINCENREGIKTCGKCVSCTQSTTDIIEIDAASNNGVDEIRELKNKVNLVPTYGKYKVYIIDEVHMLTISAFNALLKTLEEPPTSVIFVLATTEPHKVPRTILSRCQHFEFKKISNELIEKHLEKIASEESISIEESALYEIARLSDGGMRDAINILDQVSSYVDDKISIDNVHRVNGTISQEEISSMIDDLFNSNMGSVLNKIEFYDLNGKNLARLAEEILIFLRNSLIYVKAPLYLKEKHFNTAPYERLSVTTKQDFVARLIDDFTASLSDLKTTSNQRLALELIFIKNISINDKKDNVNEEKKVDNVNINTDLSKEKTLGNKLDSETKFLGNKEKELKKDDSDIKNIRINNTLFTHSKENVKKINDVISNVKSLLINPKYSQIASTILDGTVKACGEGNAILMYKINSDVELFNDNILLIDEIFITVLKTNFRVIAVNENDWEIIKKEFNSKKKVYSYMEEPVIEVKEKTDSFKNLFNNIIEYK